MSDPAVDHILHARKAFFFLITVCFSVLLAILLAEKHDVVKAREQLSVVKKNYIKWPGQISNVLNAPSRVALARYQVVSARTSGFMRVQDRELKQYIGRKLFVKIFGWSWWSDFEICDPNESVSRLSDNPSLTAVRRFWNALGDLHIPASQMDRPSELVIGLPGGQAKVTLRKIEDRETIPGSDMIIYPCRTDQLHFSVLPPSGLMFPGAKFRVVSTLTLGEFETRDLRPVLISAIGILPQSIEPSFETVFPELNRVSIGMSELNLSELEKVLSSDAFLSTESISLVGTKVPISAVVAWGACLIAVVQLYFFLHLQAYFRRYGLSTEGLQKVPWVAFYESVLAKAVTLSTVAFLPIGLGIFLVLSNAYALDARIKHGLLTGSYVAVLALTGSAVIVILVLSIVLILKFFTLWRSRKGNNISESTAE